MIELEPCLSVGQFRDGFDTGGSDRAQDKRDVVLPGSSRKNFSSLGPHQALEADRSHAEGGVIGMSEEFGAEIASGIITDIVRLKPNVPDFVGIALQVDIRVAASFEVIEGESGHATTGFFPKMLDGRKIGIDGHGPGSLRKISEKFLKASERLVPGFRIPGSKYLERDGVPDKLPPGCNVGEITSGDHLGNDVSAGSCLDGTGMNSYAAGGCN